MHVHVVSSRVRRHMLTREMLTGHMLTGQLLTGQMLTPLSKNRTNAHWRNAHLYVCILEHSNSCKKSSDSILATELIFSIRFDNLIYLPLVH